MPPLSEPKRSMDVEPAQGAEGAFNFSPERASEALRRSISSISELIAATSSKEAELASEISKVSHEHRDRAKNLVHYMAISILDLSSLSEDLRALGLNPLVKIEESVLPTLTAIERNLRCLAGERVGPLELPIPKRGEDSSLVLGTTPHRRSTKIMVSLKKDGADNPQLVEDLLRSGTDVFRINCAHGDEAQWKKMAENIRAAELKVSRKAKILCDLSGPKIRLGDLSAPISVKQNDRIYLTEPGVPDFSRSITTPTLVKASVPCAMNGIISELKPGARVRFDDGNIEGIVESIESGKAKINITFVKGSEQLLESRRGIALPDTEIDVPALSDKDKRDLKSVVSFADMIGLSFTRTIIDIGTLENLLTELHAQSKGVTLKPETRGAVDDLGRLLLFALQSPPVVVLIPRGDLALHVGFEGIAEAQETIMRFAKAGNIPTVLATEVLPNMVTTGLPTRSEMTDIKVGAECDCIMLHSGPHIVKTVEFLNEYLVNQER